MKRHSPKQTPLHAFNVERGQLQGCMLAPLHGSVWPRARFCGVFTVLFGNPSDDVLHKALGGVRTAAIVVEAWRELDGISGQCMVAGV